jgi:hypothetical protein
MPYTLRQRLTTYVKPDTDPFMGLPYSRTWCFLTDAYIAYDNRRYGGEAEDRGTHDPLVVMARLWVIVAERIHRAFGNGEGSAYDKSKAQQQVCNYCGDTEADALIHNLVCADCHMELNA